MALEFRPGEFYGALERAYTGGAFDIRSLSASAREEDVDVHTHLDAHFVLVLSGTYISTARGALDICPAPFLVFNPAGTTHRDRFVDGVGVFVSVSLDAGTLAEASVLIRTSEVAVSVDGAAAVATAFRIAREVRGAGHDRGVLEAAAWELVTATSAPSKDLLGAPPPWAYSAYEAVMDRAPDRQLTVAAIAAGLDVHPVHLARVFRQAWGCSPGDLLRWRRAERASTLLSDGLSIAEVAAAAGFVDQSHMTRAFRAVFGTTPGAWRRARDVAFLQDRPGATA